MSDLKEIYKKYIGYNIDLDSKNINLNIKAHIDEETGEFNYDSYVNSQTEVNLEKINFKGPDRSRIQKISKYIKKHIPDLRFGLCHGTRRGTEQRDFKDFLDIEVIGTEISPTAEQFPNTIQWDFHEVKEEWLENTCFIFSNSLDHSYDPVMCLGVWMSCIKTGGKIFLQRGEDDLPSISESGKNKHPDADMFQADEKTFLKIIHEAGNGEWKLIKPDELIINKEKRIVVLERK